MGDTVWMQILAVVVPILVAALSAAAPIIITWIKKQAIVKKLHLEDLTATLIPQIVMWVEQWSECLFNETGKKPASQAKLVKAISFADNLLPWVTDLDEMRGRIEVALKKMKMPKQLNG